jgi:HEAT repeat protein
MSPDNLGRVDQYLDLLFEALYPYFERTLQGAFGPDWQARVLEKFSDFDRMDEDWRQDHRAVFNVIVHRTFWEGAFEGSLRPDDRTRIRELLSTANKSAHKQRHAISTVVVYRTLDNVREILKSIGVEADVKEGLRPQDETKLLREILAEVEGAPASVSRAGISQSTAKIRSVRRGTAGQSVADASLVPRDPPPERSQSASSAVEAHPALALARQLLRLDKAGRDPKTRARAAEELAGLGASLNRADPSLAAELRAKDEKTRLDKATQALPRIKAAAVRALVEALEDDDLDVKRIAVRDLKETGSADQRATATLTALLEHTDSGLSSEAAIALTVIRNGVAPLVAILESKNCADPVWRERHVRYYAIVSLAQLLTTAGPKPPAEEALRAVPGLTEAVQDRDPDVRLDAVKVLGQIRSAPASSIPALCSALRGDPDRDVRWAAALALGEYGGVAALVVPELLAALAEADVQVRTGAAAALGSVGPKAVAAVPDLITALDDPDEHLQQRAKGALIKIGWKPDPSDPKDAAILARPCWTVADKLGLLSQGRPEAVAFRRPVAVAVPVPRALTAEQREARERTLVEARAREEEDRRRVEAAVAAWRAARGPDKELRSTRDANPG